MTAFTSCALFPITNLPFSLYPAKRLGHYWDRVGNWEDRYNCSWNSDKLIVKMSAFYRLPHEVFVSLQQD